MTKEMTKEELQAIVDTLHRCLGKWIKFGPGDQNGHWAGCPNIATISDCEDDVCSPSYFCDECDPRGTNKHHWTQYLEDLPWADAVRKALKNEG